MTSPLLALDIGLKRTGVAISESGILARPLVTLETKFPHHHAMIKGVQALIAKHEIATLVVGIPSFADGSPSQQSEKVEKIIDQLEATLNQSGWTGTLVRTPEFHSSLDADKYYPDADRDAAAAAIILERALESAPKSDA